MGATPDQIRAMVTGQSGGNAPSGYRAKADGSLEFIPGGPADPSITQKAQPIGADNRNKLGLLDAAEKALQNYRAGGTKEGVPTPFSNLIGRGPQNAQLDEAIANVLRVESGAAIGQQEIAQARDRYAPGILSTDKTNTAKLGQLEDKIKAMRDALTVGTQEAAIGQGQAAGVPANAAGTAAPSAGAQTKTIGGVTYVKIGDQWYAQ
jgi:hypothetical protein